MILIADSGSSKVDWRVIKASGDVLSINTQGINPFFVSEQDIVHTLETRLKPHIDTDIKEVYFYGAGVTGADKTAMLCRCFYKVFPGCRVEAYSDLLAAARALCGDRKGIAAILGTGANTCFYNGVDIEDNVPACGYILGDEGGGAVLGRKLVSDYLKRQLPPELSQAFDEKYHLSLLDIIEKVYRQPMPNRFLATFTFFLSEHRQHPYIQDFLSKAFDEFFTRNIAHYDYRTYPVNIIGSIAYYFREELTRAAQRHGMRIGLILRAPIEGLLSYHKARLQS